MLINKTIERLQNNPKQLFLIDACGALLTAFFLGIVLVKFERVFGIPSSTLYFLAVIPIVYALFDFYAYRKSDNHIGPYLKAVAFMNLAYCILSVGCGIYHRDVLTIWGWSYIILEVIIIVILASIELKLARKLV